MPYEKQLPPEQTGMNLGDNGGDFTTCNSELKDEQLPTDGTCTNTDRNELGPEGRSTTDTLASQEEISDKQATLEEDEHEVFQTDEAERKDLSSDLNSETRDVKDRLPVLDGNTDPPHQDPELSDQKPDLPCFDQTGTDKDSPDGEFDQGLSDATAMQPTQRLSNDQYSDFDLGQQQVPDQTGAAELTEADVENPQLELVQNKEPVPTNTLDSFAVVDLAQRNIEPSQTVDSETCLPQENSPQGLRSKDADGNETQVPTQHPGEDLTEGVLKELESSSQPCVQVEAAVDSTENNIHEIRATPPLENPLPQNHNATEHTPDHSIRPNQDLAHSVSKQFVDIPTAGVGDEDESLPNGVAHSQGGFGDRSMYKIKSSLPMDARGDSKKRHHGFDPRLTRSMPASIGRSNIPNGYHSYGRHNDATSWGRHIPRIPSASPSVKADMREGEARRALNSAKVPPSVMKMSTVMVSARKRAVLNRNASTFYEERTHSKMITLDEAINSRPPMPFDLEGPGPWSYSPRNKPLTEDNAPEYTFGHRLHEKSGGGRTAYAKTWFNSNSAFTQKVNYDKRWPSPAHYSSCNPLLGRRKLTMLDYPSFSFGIKSNFTISKRGSENEPGPNEYNRSKSDPAIHCTAPSYSISHRYQGTTLWSGSEMTPGPGTYNPRWRYSSGNIHHPSFTIRGVRRCKRHELGPHATL